MGSTNTNAAAADLTKQLRRHEVAIAELNTLPSSPVPRAVYQRNGSLFFRTTIQKATAMEQNQLDSVKAKLKDLSSST